MMLVSLNIIHTKGDNTRFANTCQALYNIAVQINFEVADIPIVGLENAHVYFERMRYAGLPAFAIRQAAPDSFTAFGELRLQAAIGEYGSNRRRPINFGGRASNEDIHTICDNGLHIDRVPSSSLASIVSLHHTTAGRVRATLFEVTTDYAAVMSKYNSSRLPAEAHENYSNGVVDDSVLDPIGYQALLNSGDVLAFRLEGRQPLAHDFKSTSLPRNSNVIDLTLAK